MDGYDPTIEDSYRKRCVIDQQAALLDILDMAGQEQYSTVGEQYMLSNDGFVLVYSITCRRSFEEISTFQRQILLAKDKDYFPMIVVGNHCDRLDERQVSTQEGAALAKDFGCPFVEASSKNEINVDAAFHDLVRDIRKFESGERKPNASRPILTNFQARSVKRSSTNRLLTPWLERLRR
jgi:GTPase KRas protein